MNLLKVYSLVENADGTFEQRPFPNQQEQVEIGEYEVSGVRMGGAPSIQAKFQHRLCLDDRWTEQEFVEFRGERYFVRNTPSSSKNNSDARYTHDVVFLHERFVLENIYMIDSVFSKHFEPVDPLSTDEIEDNINKALIKPIDPFRPSISLDPEKRVSNSTKVVFWGNVKELTDRLNACLFKFGLGGKKDIGGYYIVIDNGVDTSEEKLISFEDKFFTEAIQEVFNIFNIPYYWQGKTCHIGVAPEPIEEIFEYGADNALMSIERQNTNEGYCNRATGTGSSENLPHYYPNEDVDTATYPHAIPIIEGEGVYDDNKLIVQDYNKFSEMRPCNEHEEYADYGLTYYKERSDVKVPRVVNLYTKRRAVEQMDWTNANHDILIKRTLIEGWKCPQVYAPITVGVEYKMTSFNSVYGKNMFGNAYQIGACIDKYKSLYPTSVDKQGKLKGGWHTENFISTLLNHMACSSPHDIDILIYCTKSADAEDFARLDLSVGMKISNQAEHLVNLQIDVTDSNGNHVADIEHSPIPTLAPEIDPTGHNVWTIYLKGLKKLGQKFYLHVTALVDKYTQRIEETQQGIFTDPKANYFWDDRVNLYSTGGGWQSNFGWGTLENQGTYGDTQAITDFDVARVSFSSLPSHWLNYDDEHWYLFKQLSDFGLSTSQVPNHGDRIARLYHGGDIRMPIQDKLMPTIFRDSGATEAFYNALNDTSVYPDRYQDFYKDKNGNQYHFEHEYSKQNPREGKFTFEDIKPSIKEMVNADGKRMDCFLDVAFDNNDSDDIIGEVFKSASEDYATELSSDSQYAHPYFFVKLPRTFVSDRSGYSFNLFNSASPDEMIISVTKGACGGCNFKIMVDEDTKQNPVVTDEDGNLLRDSEGRVVVMGTKSASGYSFVDRQQNTADNEVWVCLMKETETYGVLMPNATSKLQPLTGDSFVLLNIYLPVVYLHDAEDRLSKAIIKAMYEANVEKFNFSIQFSRIYFTEHLDVLNSMSENSHLLLRYNNKLINLYVSSYAYRVSAGNVLPEISVDLTSEMTTATAFAQNKPTEATMGLVEGSGAGAMGNVVPIIKSEDAETKPSDTSVYSSKRSDKNYLSKTKDDTVSGSVNFEQNVTVQGTMSSGATTAKRASVVGDFAYGLVGAQRGVRMLADGTIYAKQLMLEETLKVPTIQYNRAMVMFGMFIIAPAVGEIEKVEKAPLLDSDGNQIYQEVDENNTPLYRTSYGEITTLPDDTYEPIRADHPTDYPLYDNEGWAELKLEDGEAGAIEVGDMLLGFWHGNRMNSGEDRDGDWNEEQQVMEHNGNYELAGFSSVYFRVLEIDNDSSSRKRFKYVLRCAEDSTWLQKKHPFEGMNFYGFGNVLNGVHDDRQSLYIMTRDYSVRLINKDWWTYGSANVIEVQGKLDGFSMQARDRQGNIYTKWFKGYGRVGGNEYIFGNIDQFERAEYTMRVALALGGNIAPTETETVTCTILDGYGTDVTDQFIRFAVVRDSGKPTADRLWNYLHANVGNPFALTYADLNTDGKSVAKFTITATDINGIQIQSEE